MTGTSTGSMGVGMEKPLGLVAPVAALSAPRRKKNRKWRAREEAEALVDSVLKPESYNALATFPKHWKPHPSTVKCPLCKRGKGTWCKNTNTGRSKFGRFHNTRTKLARTESQAVVRHLIDR